MRFVCYGLSLSLDLEKGASNSLVLESPAVFEKFLIDIHQQMNKQETQFALYDGEKEYELSKCGDLISTPFDLTYNKKEIQKKLFQELESVAYESDIASEICELHGQVVQKLEMIKSSMSYDIEFTEMFSLLEVLKNYDIHIKIPEGRFAEKLIEYMITLNTLLGKNFFVIANCDAYLTPDDYVHIEKTAKYYNLCVLFARNRQMELIEAKNEYIIDVDLCEIH